MSTGNANDQLRAGQILADRYRVEQVIGRGGMAEVYRGRDDRLARPVALKVLRSKYGADPDLRQRFEAEARAAALVSHPNVVAVYDAGEDDSKAFIVMELIDGETLHDRIARGPVDGAFARSVGGQVLDALAAAHAKGVLHRDIKPANVLITREGQVKVADFGIAKAVNPWPDDHDQTAMNMVLGTPSYLAPERAQGEPATASSDLWAVGVVLYEAVTGVKPFEADNPIAITLAAQQARYVPVLQRRPGLDPGLAGVIEKAIDPDPAKRFASAEEMARALGRPDAETTRVLEAGPGAVAGAGGVAGAADTTRALGSPTEPRGAYGLGAGAAALGADAALGAGGSPTTILPPDDGSGPKERGPRRGTAVLVGALVALLLGGIIALVLTSSGGGGSPGTGGTTTSTTKPKGVIPPTSRATTTTTSTPATTTSTTPATSTSTTSTTSVSTTSSTSTSTSTTTSTSTSTTSTTSVSTTSTTAAGPGGG